MTRVRGEEGAGAEVARPTYGLCNLFLVVFQLFYKNKRKLEKLIKHRVKPLNASGKRSEVSQR